MASRYIKDNNIIIFLSVNPTFQEMIDAARKEFPGIPLKEFEVICNSEKEIVLLYSPSKPNSSAT